MIDLGHGITAELIHDRRVCCADEHANLGWAGIAVIHPGDDGSGCITNAFWCDSRSGDAQNIVELEQFDPLTLSGQITCSICGLTGTIRDGSWESA